jgi:hypothetical protein
MAYLLSSSTTSGSKLVKDEYLSFHHKNGLSCHASPVQAV